VLVPPSAHPPIKWAVRQMRETEGSRASDPTSLKLRWARRRKMTQKVDMKEMLEAGVHFGHKKDKWNPKMANFIFAERNGVHIFDLAQTKKKLEEALKFVEKTAGNGGTILFVGTKNQIKGIVKAKAEEASMPYLVERWPGGMLTNFQTIVKRLEYLEEIEGKSKDETTSLTKKEKLSLQRKIDKMNETFEGVKDMRKLPDVVFVSDVIRERIAIREAQQLNIPVIGICDSNATPDVEYMIPGNDDAVKSVTYIVDKVAKTVAENFKKASDKTDDKKSEKPNEVAKTDEKKVDKNPTTLKATQGKGGK
jgi:small subunit ribosomal protein S2